MNFEKTAQIEPELAKLECSAGHAGQHGASWIDVLFATNEMLTKRVGRGAINERLQSAATYEVARAGLFTAWSKGEKQAVPAVDASGQTTFLDVTEQYR